LAIAIRASVFHVVTAAFTTPSGFRIIGIDTSRGVNWAVGWKRCDKVTLPSNEWCNAVVGQADQLRILADAAKARY
jgi:hypothetical protein